jgi:hypothetical protein
MMPPSSLDGIITLKLLGCHAYLPEQMVRLGHKYLIKSNVILMDSSINFYNLKDKLQDEDRKIYLQTLCAENQAAHSFDDETALTMMCNTAQ